MAGIFGRREPYILVTAVIGFLLILEHYIPVGGLSWFAAEIRSGSAVIGGFVILYGGLGAYLYHIRRISRQGEGWIWSVVLLGTASIYIIGSLIYGLNKGFTAWMWAYIFTPVDAAMYAILMFYMIGASWKVIRIRSWPMLFLTIGMISIVMMNMPVMGAVAPATYHWGTWWMNVPTTGANRAIVIGVQLAAAALATRILLGMELGYLGRE
jgi:hypothetical protein